MGYSVSSWFMQQLAAQTSSPDRVFTFGGSDYSDRVVKWPAVDRQWDDIQPADLVIELANEDQAMNIVRTDRTKLRGEGIVKLGFTHPTSGPEYIELFKGTCYQADLADGTCKLHLQDKMKTFLQQTVGTKDAPVVFSGGTFLPSDIFWTLCTCYGGLDSTASTSNVDIDYADFLVWADVWSQNNVYMDGRFEGLKITEALQRMARMTDSAIWVENDLIDVMRFTTINSNGTVLDGDTLIDNTLNLDDGQIVNKYHVYADYSPTSDSWATDCFDVNTTSVNSYGLREQVLKDNAIWYVGSVSALNLAQRMTMLLGDPVETYESTMGLQALDRTLGETLSLVDPFLGITSADAWRVMGYNLDMDTGQSRMKTSNSRVLQPFVLDDAVNGLLDQSYNPLL